MTALNSQNCAHDILTEQYKASQVNSVQLKSSDEFDLCYTLQMLHAISCVE